MSVVESVYISRPNGVGAGIMTHMRNICNAYFSNIDWYYGGKWSEDPIIAKDIFILIPDMRTEVTGWLGKGSWGEVKIAADNGKPIIVYNSEEQLFYHFHNVDATIQDPDDWKDMVEIEFDLCIMGKDLCDFEAEGMFRDVGVAIPPPEDETLYEMKTLGEEDPYDAFSTTKKKNVPKKLKKKALRRTLLFRRR